MGRELVEVVFRVSAVGPAEWRQLLDACYSLRVSAIGARPEYSATLSNVLRWLRAYVEADASDHAVNLDTCMRYEYILERLGDKQLEFGTRLYATSTDVSGGIRYGWVISRTSSMMYAVTE